MFKKIPLKTDRMVRMYDITHQVEDIVKASGVKSGLCQVFVPHTTAGLTINENADPSVQKDIVRSLNKFVPISDNYSHMEGNSHAHIKSSLLGHSHTVIIEAGKLALGTWQGIYFCEFDGPRQREFWINIIPSPSRGEG